MVSLIFRVGQDFNPLFPYGKRHCVVDHWGYHDTISIHSSHTGRDELEVYVKSSPDIFQSTLPIREETGHQQAPAAGSGRFQSTLPIREETGWIGELPAMSAYFNPLFPYGKRPRPVPSKRPRMNFNPLFPYGKRRHHPQHGFPLRAISIHSSHTGRDITEATRRAMAEISIHSSHTGRDRIGSLRSGIGTNFNPLFPYGKRPDDRGCESGTTVFQSTLPIREETDDEIAKYLRVQFQSTLPIREET